MRLFLIVVALGLALAAGVVDVGWWDVTDPHPLGLVAFSLAAFYGSGLVKS